MTAFDTERPRLFSAICFILPRTMALISSGANRCVVPSLVSSSTRGFFSSPSTTLKGNRFDSFCTASSLVLWPMMRFTSKAVDFVCLAAMDLAACPTRRSPLGVQPTYDGVVRMPSSSARIRTPSVPHTATQEKVVPKSIPMTGSTSCTPVVLLLLACFSSAWASSSFFFASSSSFAAGSASAKPCRSPSFAGSNFKPVL
mmetsp:Transcript_42901/g.100701  ORF Transcript_42901/g.100701 Transcript_42901/m.100701 type:complete len:200 (-) Transcript_42901:465-1064(-)